MSSPSTTDGNGGSRSGSDAGSDSADSGSRSLLPETRWQRDVVLILATLLGIYALFALIGVALDFDTNGILNVLRELTLFAAVYAMLVLALNLHWGYTGLFNIGVAGFMAVGVYTMAILTASPDATAPGFGLPLWVGIVGGMAMAALVGLVAALPALRLRADYLAIVTLGLSEIIRLTFQSMQFSNALEDTLGVATNGGSGMNFPGTRNVVQYAFYRGGDRTSEPTVLGDALFGLAESVDVLPLVVLGWGYNVVLAIGVVAFYVLLVRIANSPFGRVLKAIREDELVAASLGKNTDLFKIKVFMLGCALMGLAGILWQGQAGYTSPHEFRPELTFYVFIALIIGGAGSNTGSVLGGLVFGTLLFQGPLYVPRLVAEGLSVAGVELGPPPNTFYDAALALGSLDPLPMLAYATAGTNVSYLRFVLLGVVLILVVQRRPEGLLGHRIETAAAVDLSNRSRTTATDGGSSNSSSSSMPTNGDSDSTVTDGDLGPTSTDDRRDSTAATDERDSGSADGDPDE
ncbi:branched-chain amino acid ABC transporter permease [Halomontanus rarus]|uniref:branched-chain amino acid ABC transporter permease n=1 Tax=Halomontanus rarus TaxID=3034020 RepID=UPI0023E8B970|nr:branched-chain amino acid ABC transporter permease [Halovivax sp. TS33]